MEFTLLNKPNFNESEYCAKFLMISECQTPPSRPPYMGLDVSFQGLRQCKAQTSLLSYRDKLESQSFACKMCSKFSFLKEKRITKVLIRLVCAFVVHIQQSQDFSRRGPYVMSVLGVNKA